MSTTIYNVEVDMVLVEKIVMRAVVALIAYKCGLV